MGITNPGEEYFKDGAWGWNGTKWVKQWVQPVYSDRLSDRTTFLNADAGGYVLNGSVVPDGEIWVVQGVESRDVNTDCTRVDTLVYDGTQYIALGSVDPGGADVSVIWAGEVWLKAGDRMAILFVGTAAGDDVWIHVWGYKMKVPS